MSEISREKKIEVRSLCSWDLYFNRIETNGEVRIPANGKTWITLSEIEAQVYAGNKIFVGLDGQGSHARVFIGDKDVRVLLGFEDEKPTSKQQVLDSETVKKLLDYKRQADFERNVKKLVKTKAEMNFLIEESRRLELNDFNKIKFMEEYTGFKFVN